MANMLFLQPKLLLTAVVVFLYHFTWSQDMKFDSVYNTLSVEYKLLGNPAKLEMLDFFKKNIKNHYSQSYFWVDSLRNTVPFDELSYKDFNTSVEKFDSIKSITGRLRPVIMETNDITSISYDVLNESIESAYNYLHSSPNMDKTTLFEYLLPYRTTIEPLHEWRQIYKKHFDKMVHNQGLQYTIRNIINDVNSWFVCTYGIEKRADPIINLGALQLLHRKKGGCEDAANLMAFALRSIGIPCAVDVIPYWGTSTGGHVFNTAFDPAGKPMHFDALLQSDSLFEMMREPAKVFRLTYSKNEQALASKIHPSKIPDYGLFRSVNYIDVSSEFGKTTDIIYQLQDTIRDSVIYINVFNGGKWKPVWYGFRDSNTVKFTNMMEGVAYAPSVYRKGKMIPVGNPVAYYGENIHRFDKSEETTTIKVFELSGYLKYKSGKIYTLYYFDNKWRALQKKIPSDGMERLIFHNVPKNALLLLKSEESNRKERPFFFNEKNERVWF